MNKPHPMRAVFQADHKKRFQADKKSNEEPIDVEAIRKRADELLASAQESAESIMTPWKQYRSLQATDPTAAGIYYRKNKAAIHACYNH